MYCVRQWCVLVFVFAIVNFSVSASSATAHVLLKFIPYYFYRTVLPLYMVAFPSFNLSE